MASEYVAFVKTGSTPAVNLSDCLQKGKVMEKSPIFIGVVSPLNGCVGVGLARGKEHARQRRALAPGLSKSALYGQEQIIQRHIFKLISALRKLSTDGKAANMADWCMSIDMRFIKRC